ncbi:MAG: M20/M25/M40 family metallo-hydrolase [Tissierellia bacterium]|nr:M20/M25/M40 family metallo-hydrolase [Tissierellia bacterium]
MIDYKDIVRQLTHKLVNIPSVVGTAGEWDVAKAICEEYKQLPYFQEHEDQLIFMPVTEGMRANVLAMVRGTKGNNPEKTLVLMGHLDTVGVEDYGDLKELAFRPDELPKHLRQHISDSAVLKDLDSGKYDFGRGGLDMKSGVASEIAVMSYFASHPEELEGTLISIAECDEEGNAEGITAALDQLAAWKDELGLTYYGAINTDYSTPDNKSDDKKVIYWGSIGKMLPTFYIVGNTSHVGGVFNGFDPNLLLASITIRLSYNPDFCDHQSGETAPPPVSLRQMDLKSHYDVQTAMEAYGYFNYFTLGTEPNRIISKMKDVAKEAFDDVIKMMGQRYNRFCQLKQIKNDGLTWEGQVYSWEEFSGDLATVHGEKYTSYMRIFAENLLKEQPDMDIREYNLAMVREAWNRWSTQQAPVVIVFNSSTYYPPVVLDEGNHLHSALMNATTEAAKAVAGDMVETRLFYPYISDASFLYLPKDRKGMKSLQENTPGWGYVYEHPTKAIETVSMPVVNMGTWGYDGHQITERVDKDYVYDILPRMIHETILRLQK